MKDIKFRVFDKEEKKIFQVETIYIDEEYGNSFMFYNFLKGKHQVKDAGVVIPMQHTGFKDVDGRDIYEGDILSFLCQPDTNYEVYFERGSFMCGNECLFTIIFMQDDLKIKHGIESIENHKVKIIGNIYENPKIIKTIKNQLSTDKKK